MPINAVAMTPEQQRGKPKTAMKQLSLHAFLARGPASAGDDRPKSGAESAKSAAATTTASTPTAAKKPPPAPPVTPPTAAPRTSAAQASSELAIAAKPPPAAARPAAALAPAPRRATKRVKYVEDDDEEEDLQMAKGAAEVGKTDTKASKRKPKSKSGSKRTLKRQDSDSEDEYAPDDEDEAIAAADEEADDDDDALIVDDDAEEEEDDDVDLGEDDEKDARPSAKKTKKTKPALLQTTPRRTSAGIGSSLPGSAPLSAAKGKPGDKRHTWLLNPRDKNGRKPGDPDFDPTTLHVPREAWASFTPFEKQYWEVKKDRWDTILFFKKGKFYELYEKDADIGHREFQLKMTDRVNMSMVGVPEATFTDWAARFLAAGYKVARADERETALAKQMRERKSGGANQSPESGGAGRKIIERSLAAVYTQGTLMGDFVTGDMSNYILSIKEEPSLRRFGICFADTATAEFNLVQFDDDAARTHLETLLVQVSPKEVVTCKNNLSKETLRLLKVHAGSATMNVLESEAQFWSADETRRQLQSNSYFTASTSEDKEESGKAAAAEAAAAAWPEVLRQSLEHDELASAFGGLVSYFKSLLIDGHLLTQGTFRRYDPLEHGSTLVLDGQTLQNLDVLENSVDRSTRGTLLELLCHCHTAFGKRLFRRWLCHPLKHIPDIVARQNAVADLEQQDELRERLQQLLKKLPDLERLLSRVHVGSCKLADLLALLDAIEQVESVMRSLSASVDLSSLQSARLRRLLTVGQGFPELQPVLTAMQALFDRKKARDEGSVLPRPGAMPEYDAAIEEAKRCEALLQEELQAACDVLGAKAGKAGGVVFWHPNAGKERYQLQVPSNLAEKVPSSWRLLSSTKNVRRYHSPGIKAPLQGWLEAEETQTQVLRNFFRTILQRLDGHNGVLSAGVATLAELDCLMSLHTARAGMGEPMCRPEFVPLSEAPDQRALLDFTGVRHPCMSGEGLSAGGSSGGGAGSVAGGSTSFIPNDTRLGVAEEGSPERIMLLTGPNMGGKSTLLRQTCVAVILAQLGGWVPAERCRLTPVDRIFTRIGANDNIMAGHSTFMVELKETAAILNKATPQSLVILDELGRGTSTFDGYAIAHAVLKHLAEVVRCRCMFATHYHLLTDEFERHLEVGNYNMACVVDEERHDVLFLYKLQRGVCSKSYGMNVAAMAGVPASVIEAAKEKAKLYEATSRFGRIQDRRKKQLALANAVRELSELCQQSDAAGKVDVVQRISDILAEAPRVL